MEHLIDRITELKLAVIVILSLTITAIYSFFTKEYLASDSLSFLLEMISSNHMVDFYIDRQFANYLTQIFPFLLLKSEFLGFQGLINAWGLSFVFIPVSILLLSLKNVSNSYRNLNLFLILVITFYMLMSSRWITESIVCLVLTIYIYTSSLKRNQTIIDDVIVCIFSLLLIKSYSTTAFTNVFLIYSLIEKGKEINSLSYISIFFLTLGVLVGWESILYPLFPASNSDTFVQVKFFLFDSLKQFHLILISLIFILVGLVKESSKTVSLALIPFTLQFLPSFWLTFSELVIYRYFLSLPLVIVLIVLTKLKHLRLNDKKLSLILVFGMISVVPSVLWRTNVWSKTISKFETFYTNGSGDVNMYNSEFQKRFSNGYLNWESIFFQLLLKKNQNLNLYYKGPLYENWVQEDYNRREKSIINKGWR